jgi:hypothetical protein
VCFVLVHKNGIYSLEYVRNGIKTASAESPVYLFAIQNTKVDDAAKKLNESTPPPFRLVQSDEKFKVSSDANDVQYFLFNDFDDYNARVPTLIDKFIAVLSEPSAFEVEAERKKRVVLNDDDDSEDEIPRRESQRQGLRTRPKSRPNTNRQRLTGKGKAYAMPIVLPPFNRDNLTPKSVGNEYGTCLFYMESLIVYVFNKNSPDLSSCGVTIGSRSNHKFLFSPDSVNCIQKRKPGDKQEFT